MERDEAQHRIEEGSATGAPVAILDLRGLKCPLPALRTEKRLTGSPPGTRLAVLADDPMSPLDIAHLCASKGHDLVSREDLPSGGWRFVMRRGAN